MFPCKRNIVIISQMVDNYSKFKYGKDTIFKWLKLVLFQKLRKVTKYAGGFSILYFRNVSIVIVN